ncbi:hypothetical protein AWM70_21260 [Paenibacillus yonginensis]|uniref:Response regulatory domain-containing protein n=1 Tax=Paenibacillus yonginensis TaxID=1462996 RepID=A0A1B1N5S5_9BACL|nr:response regulator [Paenibacillus yonginensis]ANS76798.1 hypothetical protein AWM70_21260 [Paenibacillus yonginensis]
MIRALLIDDENLALRHLENLLWQLPDIESIESYTDPVQAITIASEYNPNVIFLDIAMPGLNGMQAAEMLQQACPEANVVFVTAYDAYAIEAFELNALDYVLKPVQKSRLEKTIQRLADRLSLHSQQEQQEAGAEERIFCCFHSLRLISAAQDPSARSEIPLRWRTSKAQELFAYLLHNRNRFVSKDALLQQFWPEYDFKKASTHLYTTIYHVRQCLKQARIQAEIINKPGNEGYVLQLGNIAVDVDVLENGILSAPEIKDQNAADHQGWSDWYTGDYFGEYDYPWAAGEQQRLRALWMNHAIELADFYAARRKYAEALKLFQKIVIINPYSEEGHLGLMKIFSRLGELQAVEDQYNKLSLLFEQDLGINVPAKAASWFKEWRLQNPGWTSSI